MEYKLTYYQPFDLPEELASFMVFRTREDCKYWLEDNGYDYNDFEIVEYHDDDIEEPTFLDRYGNYEDGMGSVGCYNTEKDLDEGFDILYNKVKSAEHLYGSDKTIAIRPCRLYEDGATLCSTGIKFTDYPDECPTVVKINTVAFYTDRGEGFPLENITDYDDFMMLADAVDEVLG